MKNAKEILLSLVFAFSFTLTIFYFINSILATIKPPWYHGDDAFENIFWWVFFGLFFLSSISSFFWLTKKINFWGWKIPALIILPFSIPYLILDYWELKETIKKPINFFVPVEKNYQATFLWTVIILNFIIILLQVTLFFPMALGLSKWLWFLALIPLFIFSGSAFLILDYFYPNKIFKKLGYWGLTLNWFYLFWDLVKKNEINYFFNPLPQTINDQPHL